MVPKPPPRMGEYGFVYVPPFRIQGVSVAGEQTCVQIPELDVAFDIGTCPRIALSSPWIAVSHGHMDHIAGLPYYFSQRIFQQMGVGKCVCHAAMARSIGAMMRSWVEIENQRTEHEIIGLEPGQQIEVKNNIYLKAVEVSHTVPSLGYSLIERRSKLREEFRDQPQTRLRELKASGVEITRVMEIPLVSYTGDTELSPSLFSDEFSRSQIVITECTFLEDDHRSRAKVGKHLHIEDLASLMKVWQAPAVILVHMSRRSDIAESRACINRVLGPELSQRIHILMDHRTNRQRYEQQKIELGEPADA
jgi:ribonuclease Z